MKFIKLFCLFFMAMSLEVAANELCPKVNMQNLNCLEYFGEEENRFTFDRLKIYEKEGSYYYLIENEFGESERQLPIINTGQVG